MDRFEDLQTTLESYASGSALPDQVVIVDQSRREADQIAALASRFSARFPVVYDYQETPSLTKARNRGLQLATGDLLIYSDDDITVRTDTLCEIRDLMHDDSLAMIAGLDPSYIRSTGRLGYLFCKKSWKRRHTAHVTRSMLGRFPAHPFRGTCEAEWSMGFFFVLRRQLVEQWQLRFDEKLTGYAYPEDLDFTYAYSRKAEQAGMRCILTDRVQVWHRVTEASRIPSKKSTMMFAINRLYLSYKHFPTESLSRSALHWSLAGDVLLRAVRRQKPCELMHAIGVARLHKKELQNGVLRPEWYQE